MSTNCLDATLWRMRERAFDWYEGRALLHNVGYETRLCRDTCRWRTPDWSCARSRSAIVSMIQRSLLRLTSTQTRDWLAWRCFWLRPSLDEPRRNETRRRVSFPRGVNSVYSCYFWRQSVSAPSSVLRPARPSFQLRRRRSESASAVVLSVSSSNTASPCAGSC